MKTIDTCAHPMSLEYGRAMKRAEDSNRHHKAAIEGSLHTKAVHVVHLLQLARRDMEEIHCVRTMQIQDEFDADVLRVAGWGVPRHSRSIQSTLDGIATILEKILGNGIKVEIRQERT